MIGCKSKNMQRPEKVTIKIIETTDVHGALFPEDLINQETRSGSLAQVFTFVKQERLKPNQEVILLDNGDILQGDPTVYFYNFEETKTPHLVSEIMNFMEYDAATIGNHDIEAGHQVYDKFKNELNFDLLAANAVKTSDTKPYFKPYTIIEKQGIKVAILGLITPSIPNWLPEKMWTGIYFEDMVESAEKWVKQIKETEKPDAIIGLFHSGVNASYGGANPQEKFNENASKLVAEKVNGLDVIFTGHDHQFANFYVKNPNGDSTLILNPGAYASQVAIAQLDFIFDKNSQKYSLTVTGNAASMENVKPDSNFIYRFNLSHEKVRKYVNQPIGHLNKAINAADALFGPSAFVDLVHQIQLEVSGADISLASPFSLSAQLDTGVLFVRDLFKLYRFENYLYILEMSGLEVKNALEFSYNLWIKTMQSAEDHFINIKLDSNGLVIRGNNGSPILANPYYNFDSGGGIIYEVDLTKPVGERVEIISFIDGTTFDLNKKYKIAMNSYRANGGGNVIIKGAGIETSEIKERIIETYDIDFRLQMKNWIKSKGKISAKASQNWAFSPKGWSEKGKIKFLLKKN